MKNFNSGEERRCAWGVGIVAGGHDNGPTDPHGSLAIHFAPFGGHKAENRQRREMGGGGEGADHVAMVLLYRLIAGRAVMCAIDGAEGERPLRVGHPAHGQEAAQQNAGQRKQDCKMPEAAHAV